MSKITENQLAAFGEELEKLSSKWYAGAAKSVGQFGKRQLHSLTGWTPHGFNNPAGIESIGAGAANAREELAKAVSPRAKELAAKSLEANERAQEMGLTSLPGTIKAFAGKDRKKALRAALNQQWAGTTPMGKVLTVGLPAAGLAADAISDDDGEKGKRLGAGIAGTAAGMLTGGVPMAGGMAAGLAASYVGGKAGGLVDKIRGPRKPPPLAQVQAPPNPEDVRGQAIATDRIMSPAASGHQNEGMG